MSMRRIRAVMLQHVYITRHSPMRVFELFYWPLLELVLWGYIATYLGRIDAALPGGVTVLLGAVVLWDMLFRSQQELHVAGLIDVWERNYLNLYASPLRHSEYFLGILLISAIRVLIGSVVLVVVARLAFGFDVLTTGATLVPALLVLMGMGWTLGLIVRAAILRFGMNAEVLAWSAVILVQPVCAVFYPVDVLPGWLQAISWAVPASHVFEAMRAFLATGEVLAGRLALGALLDVVYLFLSAGLLAASFRAVRVRGLLSRPGY